jgi:hypothetical protein
MHTPRLLSIAKACGSSLSTTENYAVALAVAKLADHACWLPGRSLWSGDDLNAFRLERGDGTFHIIVHKRENGFCRWHLILTPEEMESRIGTLESHLDPSPPILSRGLVGRNATAKMFDVERLGAILIEHRKFGKLDMHEDLRCGLSVKVW